MTKRQSRDASALFSESGFIVQLRTEDYITTATSKPSMGCVAINTPTGVSDHACIGTSPVHRVSEKGIFYHTSIGLSTELVWR